MIRSKIFHYATLSSTMDAAADLVSSEMMDELDYALVIADIQTKGRGQRGNNWHSEEGNLYLSIIFHHVDVSDPPFLSLQIALLVKEVLMQMGLNSEFIQFKWPNDIFIHDKKVCGILIEQTSTKNCVVVGIGMNVNSAPTATGPLGFPAIRLNDVLKNPIVKYDLLTIFQHLLSYNAKLWRKRDKIVIISEWMKSALFVGQMVSFQQGSLSFNGKFLGLSEDGATLIELNNSVVRSFFSGTMRPTV